MEHEQDGNARTCYGKSVLQELSSRLTKDFGKGFSVQTLQQMKKFYVMFPNTNALRSQLAWTHYRRLLSVENEQARQWYMDEAIASAWMSSGGTRNFHFSFSLLMFFWSLSLRWIF